MNEIIERSNEAIVEIERKSTSRAVLNAVGLKSVSSKRARVSYNRAIVCIVRFSLLQHFSNELRAQIFLSCITAL